MRDVIITGASRGIGRALAIALATHPRTDTRLILTASNGRLLEDVGRACEAAGVEAERVQGDLATLAGARRLAEHLAEVIRSPATLVHNAGVWPPRRELTSDGLETAFAVNCASPLVMQRVLIDRKLIRRVMVISAGLIVKGRYTAEKTPTGEDFSTWRTYCSTKLAFAIAEREVAAAHKELDVVVLHPGVVRTDLGARRGLFGFVLSLSKRAWERPEVCAARLRNLLDHDRWSPPGEARWMMEDKEAAWPAAACDDVATRAVIAMMRKYEVWPGSSSLTLPDIRLPSRRRRNSCVVVRTLS